MVNPNNILPNHNFSIFIRSEMIRTKIFSAAEPTRQFLGLIDIIVLTTIFFGLAIYQSTQSFLELHQAGQAIATDLGFSANNNYWDIGFEVVSLAVAGGYLLWRQFDFSQLDFRINRYTLPLAVLFGVSADMVAGSYDFIHNLIRPITEQEVTESASGQGITPTWIAYALLNGFYEELFFLGLMFCVPKRYYSWIIAYSLLVRFSFHTYQGLESAIVITGLGVVFLIYRWRVSALLPFMLAHAFFDITGYGATSYRILQYLWGE